LFIQCCSIDLHKMTLLLVMKYLLLKLSHLSTLSGLQLDLLFLTLQYYKIGQWILKSCSGFENAGLNL